MGKKIKKVLITTGLVSMVILSTMITGCSKKEAVTTESTQVEAVFESQEDLNISTQQTSVSKELAEQASKEVEELTKLEEEGRIEYDEVSGDIVNHDQEKQNQDMMNVIRQEVIDGEIKGEEIDEEVDMWCGDFLSDTEKSEFKSELHLLEAKEAEVVPEATKPQPQETKSQTSNQNQPKETQAKPVPQPTQATEVYQESVPQPTEPVVNEPAPQPTPQPENNNNTSGEIDTSGWNTGGVKIEVVTPDADQSLSPEEEQEINEIQFN